MDKRSQSRAAAVRVDRQRRNTPRTAAVNVAARAFRRWPAAAVICVGLIVLGAGVFVAGSGLQAGGATALGPNVAINAGATDKRQLMTNNSPTLVRNPLNRSNLVVSNRIDSPSFSCALDVSF